MMAKYEKVLIAGGTGMIGKAVAKKLKSQGFLPVLLSRNPVEGAFPVYKWDLKQGFVDPKALQSVRHVINLAGSSLASGRWTKKRKEMHISSRVESTQLLVQSLEQNGIQLQSFTNASAIGYYGDQGATVLDEGSPAGTDFMAEICQKWESAAAAATKVAERMVILRIGIVLDRYEGALPQIAKSMKFGLGVYFGSGKMIYSTIHLDDLVSMFLESITNHKMKGIYNAVGPEPVEMKNLVKAVARAKKIRVPLLPAPRFMMKLILGEQAAIVLNSTNVQPRAFLNQDFRWQFPDVQAALQKIYS